MERQEHKETIIDLKVDMECDVHIKEQQPDSPDTGVNILEFEEDVIRFKPERTDPIDSDIEEKEEEIIVKDFKVVITKFDNFDCIACDGHLDTSGLMKIYNSYNNEMVLFCYTCYKPEGKMYICVKCDRGFTCWPNLIDHVNGVHRRLKKYKCTECDAVFAQQGNLKRHVDSRHRQLKYECQECKKSFSRRDDLNAHVNFTHRKSKIFPCSECSKAFPTLNTYKTHINGVHRKMKEKSL